MPRNVEPSVHRIDNVYVYNIDDLEQQVALGLQARKAEVDAAETIVAAELADFESWRRSLAVTPAIVALRTRTVEVLRAELERAFSTHLRHLGEADREALRALMESSASKLLHAPTTRLRERASLPEGVDWVRAVADVFDLPEVTSTPPPAPEGPEASLDEGPVSATKRLGADPEAKAGAGDERGRDR